MTGSRAEPRLAVPQRLLPEGLRGYDAAAAIVDLDGETMGTFWRVRAAVPPQVDPSGLAQAIQARLDGICRQLSHWDESSDLVAFNRAQAGSWVPLAPDLAQVVAGALTIAERSGGAFDPAIGRLTDLWGLGPRPSQGEPAAGRIAEALSQSGWQRLALDADRPALRQPGGLWLDLSGIAKGWAADAMADLLANHDIHHALAEVGGECVGRGIRPDGDPWWVEAEAPDTFTGPPLRIALHQLAVATSGDYLAGAHSIDPHTGRPAIHATTAATVIHPSGLAADAWASAMLVLPPERAKALAVRENLCVRLIHRDGSEWCSPALEAMF